MGSAFTGWDPWNKHVQGGIKEHTYLNGRNTLLCAGPPYLNAILDALSTGSSAALYPIGLAQNFAVAQNSAVQQIPEIGSDKTYGFRGRTVRQVSLGRVMYNGPSLLRTLYSWYKTGAGSAINIESILDPFAAKVPDFLTAVTTDTSEFGMGSGSALPTVHIPPGYDNLWLNLASDIFRVPTGCLALLRDSEDNNVGAYYLEQMQIPTHTWAVDSQGLIMQETVAAIVGNVVPINVSAVQLLRANAASALPSQPEFVSGEAALRESATS